MKLLFAGPERRFEPCRTRKLRRGLFIDGSGSCTKGESIVVVQKLLGTTSACFSAGCLFPQRGIFVCFHYTEKHIAVWWGRNPERSRSKELCGEFSLEARASVPWMELSAYTSIHAIHHRDCIFNFLQATAPPRRGEVNCFSSTILSKRD